MVYICFAQEARLCVSRCRRDFSKGCVGRDQVADKTFGFSELVARPRTGWWLDTWVACRRGQSCKAGADSARKRIWDRGRCMMFF